MAWLADWLEHLACSHLLFSFVVVVVVGSGAFLARSTCAEQHHRQALPQTQAQDYDCCVRSWWWSWSDLVHSLLEVPAQSSIIGKLCPRPKPKIHAIQGFHGIHGVHELHGIHGIHGIHRIHGFGCRLAFAFWLVPSCLFTSL